MFSKELPKISIVTPSFNQAPFLESTIQSVLSQNYPNLEYIIIDGGSTDGSQEIIKKYESYLHFWCSEPDVGQYDAINKGFAHSTGEIMAWLNSDDMYFPWALRTVASIMVEIPQVEWLTTLSPGTWDWHGFCQGFHLISGFSREAFLDGCYLPPLYKQYAIGWIQQESTFWRRSLWNRVGSCISDKLNLASDFNLWCHFYTYADLYGTVSPLGGFREQVNQKSRKISDYLIEAENSLTQMRVKFQWKPNYSRKIALHLGLNKISKVRSVTKSLFSYTGKHIVRRQANLPCGNWEVQEYNFMN